MKSRPVGVESILATDSNTRRDDARGGSFLLAHQQLGALALGTTPTNGQTVTVIVNGTSVVFTAVTGSPTNPGDVKAPGTAAGFVTNLIAALRRPDVTTATFVALSGPNQQLIQYVGWAWPGAGTSIVPFSLNKNVNGAPASLTSFNITTTVTSGTWTAQTMQLYIEDGTYYIGTTRVLFTGGSTPTFTAPVSNPRIDIVTADSSGTIAITQGSENVSPTAPAYPANKIVLAEVYNVVGETAIYDNEDQQASQGYVLNDVRTFLAQAGYIASTAQVASGLFIPDPGSDAQGDILYYNGGWVRLPAGTSGNVLATQGAGANPHWVPPNVKVSFDSFVDTTIAVPTGNIETVVASGTVIGMGANDSLLVRFRITPPSTPTQVIALQLNGTDLFTIAVQTASIYVDVIISNRNSVSAQVYSGNYFTSVPSNVYINGTAAISLGSNFTLAVTGKHNQGSNQNFTVNQLFVLPING